VASAAVVPAGVAAALGGILDVTVYRAVY